MQSIRKQLIGVLVMVLALTAAQNLWAAQEVPRISPEQLKTMLEEKDIVLIDVRPTAQWDQSEAKLPGAHHEEPFKADEWGRFYAKERTIVIY